MRKDLSSRQCKIISGLRSKRDDGPRLDASFKLRQNDLISMDLRVPDTLPAPAKLGALLLQNNLGYKILLRALLTLRLLIGHIR
jgi:hypothetical protein